MVSGFFFDLNSQCGFLAATTSDGIVLLVFGHFQINTHKNSDKHTRDRDRDREREK